MCVTYVYYNYNGIKVFNDCLGIKGGALSNISISYIFKTTLHYICVWGKKSGNYNIITQSF